MDGANPRSAPMGLRAVLYLRQSLDQAGSHEAVRRQEADCRALARSNAWSVVDVFCDNDVSATARRRPAFDEMMRAVQGRQTDVIVTWHIDRSVRRLADLEPVLSVCTS
jgi:DNA invertase Pin-like site-specific DNA recombinase